MSENKIMGYKEDGTCATYPTEESLFNNAKIEGTDKRNCGRV